MPATIGLLGRAVALLPVGDEGRHELMCELGIAHMSAGDTDACNTQFHEAAAGAAAYGHRRVELRATVEVAYARLMIEPEGAAAELLAVAEGAIPAFEAFEDDRSLARVWMLTGYVMGGIRGREAARQDAEERALTHYRRTAFPTATCLQQLAAAIYWGPTPVPLGISRCTELSADETIGVFGRASILPLVGGLHAQLGDFATARELIDEAEHELSELGALAAVAVFCGAARSDLELLAGDLEAAEAMLRDQCEYFERIRNRITLAARAAKLAETLYRQDRLDDARHWAAVSRANTASDDTTQNVILLPVEAKLRAREGSLSDARELAREAVRLADETDTLNVIASTRLAMAAVLRLADVDGEAEAAIREAIALFELKGNVVAAARARDLLHIEVVA